MENTTPEILPLISVGVVALNEQNYLPALLHGIEAQDYPHEKIQVVLVDSSSTDNTLQLMQDFAHKHGTIADVIVRQNPGKTLPKGWNIFLANATGDVLVRIDAHARIPRNFLSMIAQVLAQGEDVVGGPRPTVTPPNATPWQRMLHAAEESVFGASIAKYRGKADANSNERQYVKSVFHIAYRRSVVATVGAFDERLARTEDNDYSYRIRKAGYRIRFDERIHSEQIIRPTLRAMVRQKRANGYWIGRTLFIQPGSIEPYHLVPAAFVMGLALSTCLALQGKRWPLAAIAAAYGSADAALAFLAAKEERPITVDFAALPVVFPVLHIGYGLGTCRGIISGLIHMLKDGKHS